MIINLSEKLPDKLQNKLLHKTFVFYGTIARPLQLLAIPENSTLKQFQRMKKIKNLYPSVNGKIVSNNYKLKHGDIVTWL